MIRHLCENRYVIGDATHKRCCNPAHLATGTSLENEADKIAAGRNAFGARQGLAKLNDDKVREIRSRYAAGGVSYQDLADEFGVALSQIASVVKRRTWKHVV
jgi:DNA-directed RNA polymerase specialized sigma24 family protein